MLAFSGAEITDERWHLEAIFRTSKKQEDVQRRNVYPLDLLTIWRTGGKLEPFPLIRGVTQGTACVPAQLGEMD